MAAVVTATSISRFRTLVAAVLMTFIGHLAHAQQQPLLLPSAEAYDAAGNLYFVDTNRNQVFEVSLSGAFTTVAGTGVQGFSGDGAAAINAELNTPQGIAVGPDGTVYIADTGNQRIRSISAGQIATIAGTGVSGFSGDNGPAVAAALSTPTALAIDAQGDLLLCDTANQRVRSISAGVITTIAGTGVQGFSGDGSAATTAELDSPAGVALANNGTIYIADSHNHRLRAITANGFIQTIAGTGVPGYSGDGNQAIAAQLSLPRGIGIDAAGNILFADADNQRIRSIDPQGIITTLAGTGVQGFSPDETSATAAALNTPRSVVVSGFGSLVFSDTPNQLVREVAANGELYTVAVLAAPRSSAISLTAPSTIVYGQGSATVAVSGSVATPQGSVALQASNTAISTATLSSGTVTFPLTSLSAGAYMLTASYSGDGLNPAASSAATSINISRAQSTVTLEPIGQTFYAGQTLTLTAVLGSVTSGVPTGEVDFADGATIVAKATAVNGIAGATYLISSSGSHTLTAIYNGDGNFLGNTSAATIATVATMPDFSIAATASSQTVQGGYVASFPISVASTGGAFTGNIVFSDASEEETCIVAGNTFFERLRECFDARDG